MKTTISKTVEGVLAVVTGLALSTHAGVVATDGNVPAGLFPGGTETEPAIYIIGENGPFTRDYGATPLDIGYKRSTVDGYSWVHLHIRNGSSVTSGDDSRVGSFSSRHDRLVRLTGGSTWTVNGKLSCPTSGWNNNLEIYEGSVVDCQTFAYGGTDSDGMLIVSNANSRMLIALGITGGTASGASSRMIIQDLGLVRVDAPTNTYIDTVDLHEGFFAWKGDHSNEDPFYNVRGWNGTNWQDVHAPGEEPFIYSATYCETDAEAKLLTADPAKGFAGYDGLGGYTLYTSHLPTPDVFVETDRGREDFSTNQNPNGVWSYGTLDKGYSNFTLLDTYSGDAFTGGWHVPNLGHPDGRWVWVNFSDETRFGAAPGQLSLHPRLDSAVGILGPGFPGVMRWTAPRSGSAHVVGRFYEGDTGPGNNRVSHAGEVLWSGDAGTYDLMVSVSAGDTIDFTAAGQWNYGSAPVDAYIELIHTNSTTNLLMVVSEHGNPSPPIGTNEVLNGTTVPCSVAPVTNGLTSYSASGWRLTGQPPAGGTTNAFNLLSTATTATLTWHWQTNFWLQVNVNGSGSVTPTDGFHPRDSVQTLSATPATGWLFLGWTGDASGTNDASVTMTAPRTVVATFSEDADGDGLTNTEEANVGSNPWLVDTDGDGFDDKTEVDHGLNAVTPDGWITDYIRANGTTFDLYPSNAVLDVALGQLLIETAGGTATLRLQLRQTDDLVTWTNAGAAVTWQIPIDAARQFLRVRSAP